MQKTRRHLYEGMYILSATLSEEARKKALEKILASIQEQSGEVEKIFEQGRRKLSYEINGKREGFYYVVFFTSTSTHIAEMWKEHKLNEDLIRFMTLRAESVPEELVYKQLVNE